jgi:Family of unknown function (DUF6516)
VTEYEIITFEQLNESYFLKCKILLKDNSKLFVLESFRNGELKYSYHWQDQKNVLIIRWDNAPHHKKIETFPHHLHNPSVLSSPKMNLTDVLSFIESKF